MATQYILKLMLPAIAISFRQLSLFDLSRTLILLASCVPTVYAHDSSHHPFTQKSLIQYYDNVTANRRVSIQHFDDYILVTDDSGSVYAFTRVNHPGHPGYIEWRFTIVHDDFILNTVSEHGKNSEAFHRFESEMNKTMAERFSSRIVYSTRPIP